MNLPQETQSDSLRNYQVENKCLNIFKNEIFENTESKDPLKSGTGELLDSRRSNLEPISNKNSSKGGN